MHWILFLSSPSLQLPRADGTEQYKGDFLPFVSRMRLLVATATCIVETQNRCNLPLLLVAHGEGHGKCST